MIKASYYKDANQFNLSLNMTNMLFFSQCNLTSFFIELIQTCFQKNVLKNEHMPPITF